MSKEKQIDEISKLICTYPQCIHYNNIGECANAECRIVDKTEALYNAGYRKQSEGEWKDMGYYIHNKRIYKCSVCATSEAKDALTSAHYCPNCGAKMKGA